MSLAQVNPIKGVRFEDLPEQAWPRQEIIDGSLYVSPAPDSLHQVLIWRLGLALEAQCPRELQILPGAKVLERKQNDRLLIPDMLVVDAKVALGGVLTFPPDAVFLAVEVISPSSRSMDMVFKRELYSDWGIGTYWVFDVENRAMHEFGPRDRASCRLKDVDLTAIWPR